MRTLLTASVSAVLVATLTAGCGGDDPSDDATDDATDDRATATASPSAGGLTVTDGTTPEELLSCLTGAGLTAEASDAVPMGVEVPVVDIEVTGMTDYEGDPDQGASLYVFADPAGAADNAGVLTLGGSDDPANERFGVHGNVVRVMYMILQPGTPTDDEAALLGCLPAQDPGTAEGRAPTEASTGPSEESTSGATGSMTADQVLACVSAAGLTATVETEDVSYYGAEARVVVSGMPGSAKGAKVWVFTDAATAEANLSNIWFGGTPSPRLRVKGNTVTVFDSTPTKGDPAVLAVEGCLPA